MPICIRDRYQILDGAIAKLALDEGDPGVARALRQVLGPDQAHIGRAISEERHDSCPDDSGHYEGKLRRHGVELMSGSLQRAI